MNNPKIICIIEEKAITRLILCSTIKKKKTEITDKIKKKNRKNFK